VRLGPAGLALLTTLLASSGREAWAGEADAQAVATFEQLVSDSKTQLTFVKELIERGEASAVERAKQLFNEAETEFLLENYEGAAAGLLEAVSVPSYKSEPTYVQALYYLGESLYRTENFIEAKHYFRQAVSLMTPSRESRYQDTITRLIRVSELTGDAQGVDEAYQAAQAVGVLRSEVIYLYGKWTSNRRDIPLSERATRADADFAKILPAQSYYAQATYFRGALKVQQGLLDEAIPFFDTVTKIPNQNNQRADAKLKRVRDMATLAIARILAEQGKFTEAVEQYHLLPSDSEEFVDGLFERAETLVRMGNYEEALRTSEILLVVGKDTSIAADAKLLNAGLLLRLGQTSPENYERATQAFSEIARSYRPVREQVLSIVNHPDPVKYFDEHLKSQGSADFTKLLPKAAQGLVDPTNEVRSATNIQRSLGGARKDTEFSQELAKKLIDVLSRGGLDMFPQLREANGRAVQMSNALTKLESELVTLQSKLLGESVSPEAKEKLERLKSERDQLDQAFQQLPKNQDEYDKRVQKYRQVVSGLERKSFELQRKIDEYRATLNGLEKFWRDTQSTRNLNAVARREQEGDFRQMKMVVEQLEERRAAIGKQIQREKEGLIAAANGGKDEENLRSRYHAQFQQTQEIVNASLPNLPEDTRALLTRLDSARAEIDREQALLTGLRKQLRERADERGNVYRQRIITEQLKLTDYDGSITSITGQSGQLIGQIAVDALQRVSKQVYDIVVRGDVGVIDVAWARKQEHTDNITRNGKDRDDAVKAIQDRFKEVLTNAE
jgi:tetratricopeptide (TPR) repeat protein